MTVLGQQRRVHLLGTGTTASKVWGDTQFLQDFVPSAAALPPVVATIVTSPVRSHRRRRFPGDSGYDVSRADRRRLNKTPAKGAGSLPGRRFAMALADDEGNPEDGTRRQFTYQGSFANLKTNIETLSSVPLIIYSPSGHPYLLNDT